MPVGCGGQALAHGDLHASRVVVAWARGGAAVRAPHIQLTNCDGVSLNSKNYNSFRK